MITVYILCIAALMFFIAGVLFALLTVYYNNRDKYESATFLCFITLGMFVATVVCLCNAIKFGGQD